MTMRTVGGMGASWYSSQRQSIMTAWSCWPQQLTNWSMMPQLAPTKAFSARWQSRAILVGGRSRLVVPRTASAVATSTEADELSPASSGTLPAIVIEKPLSTGTPCSRSAHRTPAG